MKLHLHIYLAYCDIYVKVAGYINYQIKSQMIWKFIYGIFQKNDFNVKIATL